MSGSSNIEWTEATWNPLTGCSLVSEGCRNCYAAREAAGRLSHLPEYAGLAERRGNPPRAVFTGEIRLHPDRLSQPLRWRRPRKVFVNSMSDLFHPDVPIEFVDQVFAVMALTPRHTYQVLTKRPERMRDYLTNAVEREPARMRVCGEMHVFDESLLDSDDDPCPDWPLPNVWLGTSVEDQASADKRIPHLLRTPAAVRFLSCEPLLGPVDLAAHLERFVPSGVEYGHGFNSTRVGRTERAIDWVIAGGESGPHARPMHPDWVRSLRNQCAAAGVAFLFKQWGEWRPQPVYATDERHHVVQLDGRDRGAPWAGWGVDHPDAVVMERAGKKAAGRILDGRTHDQYPEARDREATK